ncbi:uncharacterized protein LOC123389049 isoform X3 [Mustela putorius furo]|uniref:Uncharacterized protein LOC123389049 isoform X3 n=1 Tax=Mustela putorius furo TaxID=9669 RepID=A0A8U0UTA6_MUSPF|nr:uncharacterized protein LOC123389049 isoform X3 [Mustela putorius furo]
MEHIRTTKRRKKAWRKGPLGSSRRKAHTLLPGDSVGPRLRNSIGKGGKDLTVVFDSAETPPRNNRVHCEPSLLCATMEWMPTLGPEGISELSHLAKLKLSIPIQPQLLLPAPACPWRPPLELLSSGIDSFGYSILTSRATQGSPGPGPNH